MIREQTLRARQKLVGKLPITGDLLRGSLLERTIRHTKGCPKCARGDERRPRRHQLTSPFEQVSAPVSYLCLVLDDVREGSLADRADKNYAF